MSKSPKIPSASKAAIAGIQADLELSPFNYLINSAATLGNKIVIDGKEYDFTGQGQTDIARSMSDKMAKALLDLQREKSPEIIKQRIEELKTSDPQGYAARQQLFERIMADAGKNPDRPIASDLQKMLSDELAKGSGFSDAKQAEQVREGVRGKQVASGIYRGNAPTTEEAKTVVNAGNQLRVQRQQNALEMLQSGTTPEDAAYRRVQQTIANLGNFAGGRTPTAQFGQVSSAANGPVQFTGMAPQTGTFNQNAAGQGMQNTLSIYNGQMNFANSQANPWLAGLSIGANAIGALGNIDPSSKTYSGSAAAFNPSAWQR